jgi:predicted MPP superfamily phosphohydrolase
VNQIVKTLKYEAYPIILVSDVHCNLFNLQRLIQKYKDHNFVCLGDITDLWDKSGIDANSKIINYFMEHKIPCLMGNHDEYVGSENVKFKINSQQSKYLLELPVAFNIELPNSKSYKFYHYRPHDFWSIEDTNISYSRCCEIYGYTDFDEAIVIGHTHSAFVREYANKRRKFIGLGALKFGEYGILTENGIEFKKL